MYNSAKQTINDKEIEINKLLEKINKIVKN